MPAPNRKKLPNRTQNLVAQLTELITSGQAKPGDKFPTESTLMEEYGVSRTVVREAISRLQAAGLAETRHGIGTFVLKSQTAEQFTLDPATINTLEDVIAILELRISLEVEAAALAAERRTEAQLEMLKVALNALLEGQHRSTDDVSADFRFHSIIAEASGNRYFTEILNHLGTAIIPRNRITPPPITEHNRQAYLSRVNNEHEDIFNAIARGDASGARAAMRLHLTNSKERHRAIYVAAKKNLAG